MKKVLHSGLCRLDNMNSTIEIEKDFLKLKMVLYSNGIMNVIFKENLLIELNDIKDVVSWVGEIANGRKFINLMEGADNTDLDTEVRSFAASSEENKYTIADAMVISNQAQRIVTNFYLKVNKPYKPTKIFTDRDKAIDWLLSEKEKFETENINSGRN